MRIARLIGPELEQLLHENPADVAAVLDDVHPEDLADIIEETNDDDAVKILSGMPTEYAAQIFERLGEERQRRLAELMSPASTAEIALEMAPDDRADFMGSISAELGGEVLEQIEQRDPEIAEEVVQLRQWPKRSAGGLMTTGFVAVSPQLSIREAIEDIRTRAAGSETIDVVYVTEKGDRLVGVLSLRDILLASATQRVAEVMTTNVISVPPEMDQEEVSQRLAKYDLNTMPVVSEIGQLLGVITADDILDVLTEEQDEDVQKLGAVGPLTQGYFETSFSTFLRKRAPWLSVLFVGGFMTTHLLRSYEEVLNASTRLAFYLPLLISSGGNSGSQSSTLIIRGLATGDIQTKDWWRVFLREVCQGMVLGSLLASFGVLRAFTSGDGTPFAILVGTTVVAIVSIGCVIGAMTPILLHRFGIDPATSSNPFIATFCDVMGIMMYLNFARLMLHLAIPMAVAPG
jgi:magnesium transporter